jgi:hypothetical protein
MPQLVWFVSTDPVNIGMIVRGPNVIEQLYTYLFHHSSNNVSHELFALLLKHYVFLHYFNKCKIVRTIS